MPELYKLKWCISQSIPVRWNCVLQLALWNAARGGWRGVLSAVASETTNLTVMMIIVYQNRMEVNLTL